jgi:pyruvate ferredoxin oxidoreductase beta subunit
MANLKELSQREVKFTSGHRACAGCLPAVALRQVTLSVNYPCVVGFATGCMEVVSTIFPYSAWNVPYIHVAFENVAAVMSGVESAYKVLKKKGRIDKEIKFIAFGGDGGTYDIGLQALSGMLKGDTMCFTYVTITRRGIYEHRYSKIKCYSIRCANGYNSSWYC